MCGTAGALSTQTAASVTVPAASNTSAIRLFFIASPAPRCSHIQIEVPARSRHAGTFARSRSPLLLREAIILVAGVTRIPDGRNGGAQAIDRTLGLVAIVSDDLAERRRLVIEVGFRRPDLRRGAGLLAALRVVRKQRRQLLRRVGPLREGGVDLGRIEWGLAAYHPHDDFGVVLVLFHQPLSRGD